MKSIVLCERTLLQESEDFKNFKEEKISEENVIVEGKKNSNGTPDGKKPEVETQNSEKGGVIIQNGDKRCLKASFKKDVSENDRNRCLSVIESVDTVNCLSSEADPSVDNERNIVSSNETDLEQSLEKNLSSESEIIENFDAQNGSACMEEADLSKEMDFTVENDKTSNGTVQIIETDKSESSLLDSSGDSLMKSIEIDVIDERELTHAESKEKIENMQSMDDIVLDMDENKENEKDEKMIVLDEFSESDLSDKHSSSCEIQVGKVETISGIEKESMWAENEFKKSEKNSTEKSEEKSIDESQDISMPNEDSINIIESEKDESHEFGSEENLVSEGEENLEEGMHIEVEESDQTEEAKIGEQENEPTDLNKLNKDTEENAAKTEPAHCRKRQIFEGNDEDPSSKKKKLAADTVEQDQVLLEEENAEVSSQCAGLSSLDTTNSSSKDQFSDKEKCKNKRRTLTEDKNLKEKLNASITNEDVEVEKHETRKCMSSVLEKFRGTLKTLTRSDLEELIIQKLCEVITERSNIGELRQKAQALEQDQERWKAKAQTLAKQMREMEMVMKKYMSEVQKQIKEGESYVVTPLKVTRSVGLQVSFYSSPNKTPKPCSTQPVPAGPSLSTKSPRSSSPKLSSQFGQTTQNVRNKVAPASLLKSSPLLQKSPPVSQQRRSLAPKPDHSLTASNKSGVQQSLLVNGRGTQNQPQISRPGYMPATGTTPQQSPQQQKQLSPLNQQQNGSKVIDLTEDDDRQTGNTGMLVKTPGIRVVNHLTQPTIPQNNRFAYLLPTTSASTGTCAGPNRQVLIATPTVPQPNRQIMCTMPPLLFKGGNVVQGAPQPQMLNQSNKVILPKTLRHPAPLPQRPINQNTRPSLKLLPPRPALKISKVQTGIVLSWNMSLSPEHAPIASYQLYAYQESDSPPTTALWKKVGDVKALPLPMACTLTQFMSGHKYHFAVRAVDLHSRIGPFSFPGTIVLV